MSYEYQQTDLLIYKAVFDDNWNSVGKTFEEHPELRTKPINSRLETPLMIAVGTNRSHKFVKSLLSSLSSDDFGRALAAKNIEGDTALHYAAQIGNIHDAKLLLPDPSKTEISGGATAKSMGSDDPSDPPKQEIVLQKNHAGNTPLLFASLLGRKNEMLEFLFSRMGVLNHPTSGIPNQSLGCGDLLAPAIEGEFLDLALKLATKHSDKKWELQRSLIILAKKPNLFISGSRLGFCGRLIYSLLPEPEIKTIPDQKTSQQYVRDEESIYKEKKIFCYKSTSVVWFYKRILQFLASPIKNIYDMKVAHTQAKELVKQICKLVIERHNDQAAVGTLVSIIFSAVEFGIYEVIEECILAYPSVIWSSFEGFHLFHEAISQRQEKLYNLVYQMSSYKAFVASHVDDHTGENALHMAAKLAPTHRLNIITGAALQMQRELQWFKEIENNFVKPACKEAVNKELKTPRMVFNDAHKDLLKEGQEWMKDTASSSTVVATLIVTMAFAVAFAVPGGNKDEGNPVYIDKGAFMLFIVSDAIALFSSATSVLMFLGILTSRYAADDFLYALPKRMTIGLIYLFLSLAATLVAFSATLALVLQDKVTWIAVPLVLLTSIPVGLFAVLQFPLLVELVYATYGPSIFRKQNKRMIH